MNGEQYETQHWIETAVECGYLDLEKGTVLLEKCKQVGRLLGGMIEKADLFCSKPIKELRDDFTEYVVHSTNDTE